MAARTLVWIILWTILPVAHAQPVSRAAMAPVERGVGLYDGRNVAFEVIDGWAVVEGDSIIGRAAPLCAQA